MTDRISPPVISILMGLPPGTILGPDGQPLSPAARDLYAALAAHDRDRQNIPLSYPQVGFDLRHLHPPSDLYIGTDDQLVVSAMASQASLAVQASGRYMDPSGAIKPFSQLLSVPSTRVLTNFTLAQFEGFMVGVKIGNGGAAARRGALYASIGYIRGGTSGVGVNVLAQDYITSVFSATWPFGRQISSTEGPGLVRVIAGSAPAAGSEIIETVPTNARWRFTSLFTTFTASAAVANRTPQIVMDDGVNTFYLWAASANITAGQAFGFVFSVLPLANQDGLTNFHVPVPNNPLLDGGFRIRTQTTNLQAGDQWGAPNLLVEEWMEGS